MRHSNPTFMLGLVAVLAITAAHSATALDLNALVNGTVLSGPLGWDSGYVRILGWEDTACGGPDSGGTDPTVFYGICDPYATSCTDNPVKLIGQIQIPHPIDQEYIYATCSIDWSNNLYSAWLYSDTGCSRPVTFTGGSNTAQITNGECTAVTAPAMARLNSFVLGQAGANSGTSVTPSVITAMLAVVLAAVTL